MKFKNALQSKHRTSISNRSGRWTFSRMTNEELLHYCAKLYEKDGISSLSYPKLKTIPTLYYNLYSRGITQKRLVRSIASEKEYSEFKARTWRRRVGNTVQRRWTWKRVVDAVRPVVRKQGFLPPAAWFQINQMGGLIQAVYNLDRNWDDIRQALGLSVGKTFVESRNGMRWRSHPEASLSNFLFARGIKHWYGRKYPKEYAQVSGRAYGYYDLHFPRKVGKVVDVEIWGEKPAGHSEVDYALKRKQKERFNRTNSKFLGIHFADCYDETRLTKILAPLIGVIKPHIFRKRYDSELPTTHWSNADELIDYCRKFSAQMPDGVFPKEDYLRKRGKWKSRKGVTYNTLPIYVRKWIGGFRKLRRILGQEEYSTVTWNKKKALAAYSQWVDSHKLTPAQSWTRYRRGQLAISLRDARKAASIASAVRKYIGNSSEVKSIARRMTSKDVKQSASVSVDH